MVSELLLKDYKKRPSITDILNKKSMKTKMALYGYSESDHLLQSTVGGANGVNLLM